MSNHQESTKLSTIEAIALPSELRRSHNFTKSAPDFASLAPGAVSLAKAPTPPPLKDILRPLELRPDAPSPLTSELASALASAQTDFQLENRSDDTDPPFRPPALWQAPPAPPKPSRSWQWSERSTAAFLGFAAGMLIIVPTVFYLSLTTKPQATVEQPPQQAIIDTKEIAEKPTPPSQTNHRLVFATANVMSGGHWVDSSLRTQAKQPEQSAQNISARNVETTAKQQLQAGQLPEARATLRASASPDAPKLWFLLAETYDPLIAKPTLDASLAESPRTGATSPTAMSATDAKFARYYYNQALTHGVQEAHARLNALQNRQQ